MIHTSRFVLLYRDSHFTLHILMLSLALTYNISIYRLTNQRTCKINVMYIIGQIIGCRFTWESQCSVGSTILLKSTNIWWFFSAQVVCCCNLYSSPNRIIKSRMMRWARHVARIGAKRNAYRILVGKPEVKRPLGRPRCRWVENIKIDLREIGWDRSGLG
jgi:hypothetical protein